MDNILNNSQLKKQTAILIIFILLGFGIYFNSLQNGFHYDDMHHVVRNPYIQSPGNIPSFFTEHRMFSVLSGVFLHYRPLVMVSYSLNYYFVKLDPAGYHLVNLAFHIGSAYLLFLVIGHIMRGIKGQLFSSLTAGLLFLTTPFNSEVVNYVTARSSVMCSFFSLLSFYCWMKYRSRLTSHVSRLTSYVYLASFLFFLFAMLTKEVAIMLPAIFVLYDIYFSKIFARFDYRVIRPYLPFGIAGIFIGFGIRLLFFKSSSLYSALSMEKKSSDSSDFISNVIIGVKVLAKYVYSIFVPVGLSVWHKVEGSPDIFFIISVILITVLLASAFLLWRRSDHLGKRVSFFILWFLMMLLPMIVVSLNAPYQENRGHIAAAGLTGAFVIGLVALMERVGAGRSLKGVIYAIVSVMIVIYSAGTVMRNGVWLNDLTLWTDADRKYPHSPYVKVAVGSAYRRSGNLEAAESEYLEILKMDPQNSNAFANIGIIYYLRKELDKSLVFLLKAKQTDPFDPRLNFYLSKVYKEKGDMRSAAKHLLLLIAISPHNITTYQELSDAYMSMGETEKLEGMMLNAIAEDPNNVGAYRALGLVSLRRGDLESAKRAFEKVLAYVPANQDVLRDLGYIYGRQGMFARSEDMFKRVIALNPNDAGAMQALGDTYQRQGKLKEALAAYQNVLNNNPQRFTSYNNLGLIFFAGRNTAAALAAFEKALGQNPNDPMARFNLARVYEDMGRKDLARKEFQRVLKETSGNQGTGKLYEAAQKKLAELQ